MDNSYTSSAGVRGAVSTADRLTAFFDGGCPLCRREVAFYRSLPGGDQIRWVDLATAGSHALPQGLTREQALARMHVQQADGRLLDGAQAFLAVWHELPRFRVAARVLDRPWLHAPLELGYWLFLRLRPALQRLAGGRAGGESCASRRRATDT